MKQNRKVKRPHAGLSRLAVTALFAGGSRDEGTDYAAGAD